LNLSVRFDSGFGLCIEPDVSVRSSLDIGSSIGFVFSPRIGSGYGRGRFAVIIVKRLPIRVRGRRGRVADAMLAGMRIE
jgi:hypothetical protein